MSLIPWGILASQSEGIPEPPVLGYSLWLDGYDESVFSFSSGSVVSEWRDKSGNDNDFAQATVSAQPTRASSGLLTFDGSNDWLEASTKFMNNAHNGGSNTFFIVAKPNSAALFPIVSTGFISSNNVGFGLLYDNNPSKVIAFVNRGVTASTVVNGSSTSTQGTTDLAAWTVRLDANATVSQRAEFYLNSGSIETGSNSRSNPPSTADSTNLPGIGSDAGGVYYANINLAEILWYESDLSTADREDTRDYLIAKWGI